MIVITHKCRNSKANKLYFAKPVKKSVASIKIIKIKTIYILEITENF